MLRRCLLLLALALPTFPVFAAPTVEAKGLMRNMAVLLIDGRQQTLRVGQTSPEGVRLLAADSGMARIEIDGREYDLDLSRRVGAEYVDAAPRSVQAIGDARGQFRVDGAVNGRPFRFLVDTGASLLAMSSRQATRLGIDYRRGEPGRVTTASGISEAWFVELEQVTVGDIQVRGVRAAIVEGEFPAEALLGMSFLRHVGFAERDGVLTLLQRF